jgi:hypothetical protein
VSKVLPFTSVQAMMEHSAGQACGRGGFSQGLNLSPQPPLCSLGTQDSIKSVFLCLQVKPQASAL